MRYRLERRLRRGEWVWAILKDSAFVGCTHTYLAAFKICAELNREGVERAEAIRGESFRRHAVAAVRARKMYD